MATSGSVFSETLQTITTTKLEELAKQRITFEEQYSSLTAAAKAESDPLKRLFKLVDDAKICLGVKTAARKNQADARLGPVVFGGTNNRRLEIDLKNLDRFLEQARYDPSVSLAVLQDWENCIYQYLSVQSHKYQYADLYGKLVTEWLSSEKASADGDVEMAESFEQIPGAKKLEARAEWEKLVFEPAEIDVAALEQYLRGLFSAKKEVGNLRAQVEAFEASMIDSSQFDVHTLRWVIQGVQSSDLLNNEKREALKDFLSNEIILAEIADVLNMRMSALDRWSWGDFVPLEQRRKVNGSFSIHMHEDLLQAIFLHYIGVKWSVFFKSAFQTLRAQTWSPDYPTITKEDRNRRLYYLGSHTQTTPDGSLQDKRARDHRGQYFVHQLLDHATQTFEIQEGEEEAEFDTFVQDARPVKRPRMQMASQMPLQAPPTQAQSHALQAQQMQLMQLQQSNSRRNMMVQANPTHRARQSYGAATALADEDDEDEDEDEDDVDASTKPKKPMEAKQRILHLLSTEIIVNTKLHGELTCFHSVFEAWNPLLPHPTVLTILKFFGVSPRWLKFFKTFLQAPLKFMDDGAGAQPRLRRRGTPGSHNLSDVFGEVAFFCLDTSVNKSTGGARLYRLYDDIWFWSQNYEKCAKAWASVLDFTDAMGVELSATRTGSVRIAHGQDRSIDDRLPTGEIRWGFLRLDATTGRFEIDMKMVDSHVEELRDQLKGKSKSVIDWIQAWNTYAATFFSSNFGKAANCFGRAHVDMMLATHRHVQQRIFNDGNVVEFLKQTIQERFGVKDIPDGFLFFPVELGGLDLKSPFVHLLQIRESVRENPYDLIDEFLETEQDDYRTAKHAFDTGSTRSYYSPSNPPWKPSHDAETFFSFKEFSRYREELPGSGSANLLRKYQALLKKPVEKSINVSVQVKNALSQLQGQSNLRGITGKWEGMEAYWKWVAQMYGPEMVAKFGGMNVVDPGLLPIGMVSMFRQKRIKWQG